MELAELYAFMGILFPVKTGILGNSLLSTNWFHS